MFHGLKDDSKLHELARQYAEALGEVHFLPGAEVQHAALEAARERLRLAREAVPAARTACERAAEDDARSLASLRTLLRGVVELVRIGEPELAGLMPNLEKHEDRDVFFACDRAVEVLEGSTRFRNAADAVRLAKANRLRAEDLQKERAEARERSHTGYKAARAHIQIAVKDAFIFIAMNAPRGSPAHQMIKRKVKPRTRDATQPGADPTPPAAAVPVAAPA